jgi:hypothetical protein
LRNPLPRLLGSVAIWLLFGVAITIPVGVAYSFVLTAVISGYPLGAVAYVPALCLLFTVYGFPLYLAAVLVWVSLARLVPKLEASGLRLALLLGAFAVLLAVPVSLRLSSRFTPASAGLAGVLLFSSLVLPRLCSHRLQAGAFAA